MYETVLELYEKANLVFKTAAVADYRVKEVASNKIKKGQGPMTLELVRNPDILLELGQRKVEQILVGFAAETEELEENALTKLQDKNLDFIVGNDVSTGESGFQSDSNQGILYSRDGGSTHIPLMNKREFAHRIIHEIIKQL